MKFDLEAYIIKKIDSGEWKENEKIPTELNLMKISDLSKMSIRKVIDKLREREVLYSMQGKGVFVSPFNKHSKIERLSEILGATKVTYLPSSSKIPEILLKRFHKDFEVNLNNIITYVKLYFIDDEIVAFTLNWINNDEKKYSLKEIVRGDKSVFMESDFNKIINIHKLEETSISDKNILLTKYEYVPTTYSYLIKKDRSIVMMRVAKIKPRFYQAFEVKNR